MIQSQREELFNWEGEYISIGISENGERYNCISVPWYYTANAYSMRIPKIYLSPEDLGDEEIMGKIYSLRVRGCYIFCKLEDYGFLNNFRDMSDLTIYDATELKDISFIESFENCRMLTLHNAHLSNIDWVIRDGKIGAIANPRCLALVNCIIGDISNVVEHQCYFNELVIINPSERNERERWAPLKKLWYYDIKK